MSPTYKRPAGRHAPVEVGRRELRRGFDGDGHARRSAGRRLAALSVDCEVLGSRALANGGLSRPADDLRLVEYYRNRRRPVDWATRRSMGWV